MDSSYQDRVRTDQKCGQQQAIIFFGVKNQLELFLPGSDGSEMCVSLPFKGRTDTVEGHLCPFPPSVYFQGCQEPWRPRNPKDQFTTCLPCVCGARKRSEAACTAAGTFTLLPLRALTVILKPLGHVHGLDIGRLFEGSRVQNEFMGHKTCPGKLFQVKIHLADFLYSNNEGIIHFMYYP